MKYDVIKLNGIFLYCEKYSRTNGSFKDGLYHYSFALNTLLKEYQPSGSMNLTKYGKITFEYTRRNTGKLGFPVIHLTIMVILDTYILPVIIETWQNHI